VLTIRLQRRGRKGNAHFRVIVQEHQYSPTSGKVVKYLGSYNPHTKDLVLDKESTEKYLSNGAQPSDRAIKIFKKNDVKLPKWVQQSEARKRAIKDVEKLRKNRPKEPKEEVAEAPVEDKADDAPAKEESQDKTEVTASEVSPSEMPAEVTEEKPKEPKEEVAEAPVEDTPEA